MHGYELQKVLGEGGFGVVYLAVIQDNEGNQQKLTELLKLMEQAANEKDYLTASRLQQKTQNFFTIGNDFKIHCHT